MGRHGGGFSAALEQYGDAPTEGPDSAEIDAGSRDRRPAATPSSGQRIPGFRHFLCDTETLPIEKRFRIDGKDPLESNDSKKRLRTLMGRLANRMRVIPVWEGDEGHQENSDIPAGYTYLLQLVAHDLVQTSLPISILQNTTTGVRNERTHRLKLDTIYGGGPEICPFAYEAGPRNARSRLRSGGGGINREDAIEMKPKGRDIARFDPEERGPGEDQQPSDVLIPDPRNDDHAILSQLTTLFHHLHNGLLTRLSAQINNGRSEPEIEATYHAFLCARGAATLVYQNVVRRDLMKRVLNRDIYERYNVDEPRFLGAVPGTSRSSVPLEFSHAAFRFGHAMVRESYRFNLVHDEFNLGQVLRATSLLDPGNMPLHRKWIASWSRFFDIRGQPPPQSSMRISPHFSGHFNDRKLFPPIDASGTWGLAYRDLMSAAFAGLWSVNGLISEIRSRQPSLINNNRLLADHGFRAEQLRVWLTRNRGDLTDADIQTLADDPPLPFFILFEAASGPDPALRGKKLGVLGSIIVAEVVFGAMREDGPRTERPSSSLKETLFHLSSRIYSRNYLQFVPEIETMGDLVAFTADIARLQDADPTFL